MFDLESFHNYCATGDLHMIRMFENIPALYDELENKDKILNGLFWSVIFSQFEVAKYLMKEKIFDPNDLFCDELHILHVLSTLGGRDTNIKKTNNQYYYLFLHYFKNTDYMPVFVGHDEEEEEYFGLMPEYDKKKVIEFTKYIIENYKLNVTPLTNKKWFNLEQSQAAHWITFYNIVIKKLASDLNINYTCYTFTPLHYALLFGYKEMVELLINNGCDIICYRCKKICKDCPYALKKFLYKHELVDRLLDNYFRIEFDPEVDSISSEELVIEIEQIEDYFTNEIFWYLVNESLHISPNSLQYASIEKIAYEIKGGKNINLKLLPERLEKEVNLFMHYRFY